MRASPGTGVVEEDHGPGPRAMGRLLPLAVAVGVLLPHLATAATVQLFSAHNVFASSSSTAVFGTTAIILICSADDVTSIVSPGSPSGVIVDNILTDNGQNLCGFGNPQLPPVQSPPGQPNCFSKVINIIPGTPANQAYKGIGMIVLPSSLTTGTHLHVFRLEDSGVVGANNRLVLQTDCRVRRLAPPPD